MCYLCVDNDCGIDCYFNVGGHCKYGIFEGEYGEDEKIQCNPEKCECNIHQKLEDVLEYIHEGHID